MSSFKIKLLTPIEATNGSQFLETTISEFYSQILQNKDTSDIFDKKNSFSYTFDEKISIHKNGQKELSFSMLKNNWLLDTWEVNPFVNNIHNGTQLLLIDKYENETMFTVAKWMKSKKNNYLASSCSPLSASSTTTATTTTKMANNKNKIFTNNKKCFPKKIKSRIN